MRKSTKGRKYCSLCREFSPGIASAPYICVSCRIKVRNSTEKGKR